MSGDYPGNTRKRQVALTVERLEPETTTLALVEANENGGEADPSAIRPALAQLAANNLDALHRALLDAALSAATTRWATVVCGGCGARSRVELPVPDVRARLQAIETLLAQGLGRPGQADEPRVPRLPSNAAAVRQMGWADLRGLAGALLVDELAAVERRGGQALLRERLGALSEDERHVLLETLLELAA
jgi:hypothetical protein